MSRFYHTSLSIILAISGIACQHPFTPQISPSIPTDSCVGRRQLYGRFLKAC